MELINTLRGKSPKVCSSRLRMDTLELMTQLVDCFDLMMRKAWKLLEKAKGSQRE